MGCECAIISQGEIGAWVDAIYLMPSLVTSKRTKLKIKDQAMENPQPVRRLGAE